MAEGFFFILKILEHNHRWHHQALLICILDSFQAKNQSTTTVTEGFFLIPPSPPPSLSLSPQYLDALVSQSALLFIFSYFLYFFVQSTHNLLKVLPVVGYTSSCILKQSQTPQPTLQFRIQFATSPTRGTPGVIFLNLCYQSLN